MIRNLLKITFLLLLFFFYQQIEARHIIGGDIIYECLGNDDYRFTLKVYRDCNCQNCAFFDGEAAIGVYRCNIGGPGISCGSLGQGDVVTTFHAALGPVTSVGIPDYPCLIPPDVCVQQALYNFTLHLPNSNQSYFVTYQRCCRNETITNIIVPDNRGATYYVEINPEAQDICNSSPEFDNFPPTVICVGEPLVFDHSATDVDGHQLVYSFCPPLNGGGNSSASSVQSCSTPAPNPACPPPYTTIPFEIGFSATVPVAGNPIISIDASTGLITGTPTFIGQYVVSVCVTEYGSNGEELGSIFRDFQFNVANCDPTVIAEVEEDENTDSLAFVITSCGDLSIEFTNLSYQLEYIDFYQWQFDSTQAPISSPSWTPNITSSDWNPTIQFPGIGTFYGMLVLNPGTVCSDTAIMHVSVFPELTADFSFDYDTCEVGPIVFTDLSTTNSCCLTDWMWDFGDGDGSVFQNPSHTYENPDSILVVLVVRDTNACLDQSTQIIPYFPVPAEVVLGPNDFLGCEPADLFFDNLSSPIDESYTFFWDFGDGGTSDLISPWHTYTTPGLFSVMVSFTSPIGCYTDTVFNNLIQIEPSPDAGFSFTPNTPSTLKPTVDFEDESMDALSVHWTFGDHTFSSAWNPTHTYRDTGLFLVTQIVTHLSGCQDTLKQWIDIKPEVRFFLPNAFTPNYDSVNDRYRGVGSLEGTTGFTLSIWDRWGELVFKTNDYLEGWNGTKHNTGQQSPNGVYLVLAHFVGPRGEHHEYKGMATLIR